MGRNQSDEYDKFEGGEAMNERQPKVQRVRRESRTLHGRVLLTTIEAERHNACHAAQAAALAEITVSDPELNNPDFVEMSNLDLNNLDLSSLNRHRNVLAKVQIELCRTPVWETLTRQEAELVVVAVREFFKRHLEAEPRAQEAPR